MSDTQATEPKDEEPEGSVETGAPSPAGEDPTDTAHPTGVKQAAENAANEPAG